MSDTAVSENIVKQEFYHKTEKFQVITTWLGIVLNIVWFLGDFLSIREYWIPFFIFRLCVSVISLFTLIFRRQLGINIYSCLFILVLGISVQNAYMWSVMDIPHLQKHAFAYIVLFIGTGMLVLWEMKFSWILLTATIIANVIFYVINSPLTVEEFITNGGLLTFTVAFFCIFLIRTRYRLTYNEIRNRLELAKSKEIIEQKHEEVVNQKKEITDSINYARSIQRSLIPSEEQFNSYFKDSFVLFKPKDIVSGDFYWMHEKNGLIFYATADCTGHGVPGGFMTMLGLSFLDEIVEAKKVNDPGVILDLMRDKIISTLRQNGNFGESKDGMDITICVVDKTKNELHYSSANNPLYIIKHAGNEALQSLNTYKADKQPCGFYHDYKPFTTQTIALEEGDRIYTFSDGFPDQFGGPNGKKYTYKQFKEQLLKHARLSFSEQKKLLNSSFIEWQGTLDQVDDVLVIGVQV